MKKYKYGLTGEGFTIEEIDAIFQDVKPFDPTTPEEYKEYMASLREATARFKAEMAALEESNGAPVTREDLEREMA